MMKQKRYKRHKEKRNNRITVFLARWYGFGLRVAFLRSD